MSRELRYIFDVEDIVAFTELVERQDHADSFDTLSILQFDTAALRTLYVLLDIPWPLNDAADETMRKIYEFQWAKQSIWDLLLPVKLGIVSAEIRGEEVIIRPAEEVASIEDVLQQPQFVTWKLAFDRFQATAYAHFSLYGQIHPASILEASKLKLDLDDFTLLMISSLALRQTPFKPTTEPLGNLPVTEEEVFESRIDLLGLREFADTALLEEDPRTLEAIWYRFKLGHSADDVAARLDREDLLTELVIWRATLRPWPSMDVEH